MTGRESVQGEMCYDHVSARRRQRLPTTSIIIMIIIITTTMFMVLSSWHSHCESSLGSFEMNADWAPDGRQASDQTNQFGLWVRRKIGCYHPQTPSPLIIITQLVSWYSFIDWLIVLIDIPSLHIPLLIITRSRLLKRKNADVITLQLELGIGLVSFVTFM